ncbi:hypothetical protein CWI39_0333p0040 [Hamiltosporidium magnivora]|uniref:Uncharacterized protein n=1 Tax=Hamiltosporidium magnivora TaxID=148818 RepID=A0A4Q9LHT6_9MICR|nr:hypothetical protein CWI39_0333p0040 [Hamiltosporidium magnivora]
MKDLEMQRNINSIKNEISFEKITSKYFFLVSILSFVIFNELAFVSKNIRLSYLFLPIFIVNAIFFYKKVKKNYSLNEDNNKSEEYSVTVLRILKISIFTILTDIIFQVIFKLGYNSIYLFQIFMTIICAIQFVLSVFQGKFFSEVFPDKYIKKRKILDKMIIVFTFIYFILPICMVSRYSRIDLTIVNSLIGFFIGYLIGLNDKLEKENEFLFGKRFFSKIITFFYIVSTCVKIITTQWSTLDYVSI